MSNEPSRLPIEHSQGGVESWEYDDVTDVSSSDQTSSSHEPDPSSRVEVTERDTKSSKHKEHLLTPGTRPRFLKAKIPPTQTERPVDNSAPVDTTTAGSATSHHLAAGAATSHHLAAGSATSHHLTAGSATSHHLTAGTDDGRGRLVPTLYSAMEQEKVANDHPDGDEERVDEDIEMIRAHEGESRGPGVGSVSVYGRDGEDVMGGGGDMVTGIEDDEEEEDEDQLNSFRDLPTRTGRLLEAPPGGDRSGSASLAPPPHLTPNLGTSSPSPDLRPMEAVGPINEDSEEDTEAKGEQAEEELEVEGEGVNEGEVDPDEEGSESNMAGATGPGGHRLDTLGGASGGLRQLPPPLGGSPGQDDEDDDEEEDDDDDVQAPAPEGAYDPAEYENLNVTPEIRELFSYIMRYTPQAIELEHRLRPYIPDYIPAVGDIDAFIKILPPDEAETKVGLTVLDEPSARQSDATVLDLQLRSLAKHTTAKIVSVKNVESAEKKPKVIEKWMQDISDLHRNKPAPTVGYSKRMPDFDSLMQEWPGELEDLLQEIRLPNAALDLDLENYAGLICAILDIPVYKSKIQSLHVLFTLYSEFRNSVHFRRLAEDNFMDNDDGQGDRLVIE